jgi:hypothetical protein
VLWDDKKLYKPFSEDHKGDYTKTKDCRAMAILPVQKDAVTVYSINNKVIDTLRIPAGVDPDFDGKPKGRRFYSKLFSSELAAAAYKVSGSYQISIDGNGLIDARKRSGIYRS